MPSESSERIDVRVVGGAFADPGLEEEFLLHRVSGARRATAYFLLGTLLPVFGGAFLDSAKLQGGDRLLCLSVRVLFFVVHLSATLAIWRTKDVPRIGWLFSVATWLGIAFYATLASTYLTVVGRSEYVVALTMFAVVLPSVHPSPTRKLWHYVFPLLGATAFIGGGVLGGVTSLAWNMQSRLVYFANDRRARAEAELRRLKEADAKAARRALEKRDNEWEAVVQAAPVLLNIVDESGLIVFANEHSDGVGLGERVDFWARINEGAEAEVAALNLLAPVFDQGGTTQFERTLFHDGVERVIAFSAAPVGQAPYEEVSVVGVDVSESRRVVDELHQAQKQQTIGSLAGGIAHDFNNLLTVIAGASEMLALDGALGEEERAQVEEIRDATSRAAGLTRQLLLFSRKKPARVRSVSLNRLSQDMAPLLRRILGVEHKLELRLDDALGSVLLDMSHGEQLLMNLVVNARDAMPNGGTIVVETRASDDAVEMSVADTGVGMSEELRAQVFSPFFTTKPVGKGTGLGLSTVRNILEKAGGDIMVESEVGKGSCFTLRFERAQETQRRSSREVDVTGVGRRVLVVDDNDEIRQLASQMLRRADYEVEVAHDLEEAVEFAKARPGLDALLVDVRLPDASGGVVADFVRELHPHVAVVFMSGFIEDPHLLERVEAGEEQLLDKPFTSRRLRRALGEALRSAAQQRRAAL